MSREDTLFVAQNPTPDTGIAQAVVAAFVGTDALLNIFNNNADLNGVGKVIEPKWIRIIPTVAPASSTRTEYLATLDRAALIRVPVEHRNLVYRWTISCRKNDSNGGLMNALKKYKAELQARIDRGDLEGARQLVLNATRDGIVDGHEGAADLDPVLDAELERDCEKCGKLVLA